MEVRELRKERDGIVREVEANMLMTPEVALSVAEWLRTKAEGIISDRAELQANASSRKPARKKARTTRRPTKGRDKQGV